MVAETYWRTDPENASCSGSVPMGMRPVFWIRMRNTMLLPMLMLLLVGLNTVFVIVSAPGVMARLTLPALVAPPTEAAVMKFVTVAL